MITTRAVIPALIAGLIAACSTGSSVTEPPSNQQRTASPVVSTSSPTAPPASSPSRTVGPTSTAGTLGRILLLRYPEPGPAEYFVVNADGSNEQPFGPRVDYEGRQVSPDESLLAVVGPNSQGMIVGGTIGVDGSGFHLFANPEPEPQPCVRHLGT